MNPFKKIIATILLSLAAVAPLEAQSLRLGFSLNKSSAVSQPAPTYPWDPRDAAVAPSLWVSDSNVESMNAEPTYGFYRPTAGAAFSSASAYLGSGGVSQMRVPVGGHELYDPTATGAVPLLVSPTVLSNSGLKFGSVNGGGVSARLVCRNSAGSFNYIHQPTNPAFSVTFGWTPDVVATTNTIVGNSDASAPGSGTTTHDGFRLIVGGGGLPNCQIVSNGVLKTANLANNPGMKASAIGNRYFLALTVNSSGLATWYRYDFGSVGTPISNPTPNVLASATAITQAGSAADAMNPLVMGIDWSSTAGTLATSTNRAQGTISNLCIFPGVISTTDIANLAAYNPVPDTVASGLITTSPVTKLARRTSGHSAISPEQLSHLHRKHDPSDLTKMFTDTGAATPVALVGDNVKYFADSTDTALQKNHREAIFDTSSPVPTTYQIVGGKPCVFWNGQSPNLVGGMFTDNTRADSCLVMPSWPLCDLTLIYVFQNLVTGAPGDTGQQLSHVFQTNSSNYLWIAGSLYPGGTGGDAGAHYSISTGGTATPTVAQGNAEGVHVYEVYLHQGSLKIKCDGVDSGLETEITGISLFGGVSVNWGWDSADLHINPLTDPTSNCNGRLRGPLVIYNTCHAEADGARVARKMCADIGIPYNN